MDYLNVKKSFIVILINVKKSLIIWNGDVCSSFDVMEHELIPCIVVIGRV